MQQSSRQAGPVDGAWRRFRQLREIAERQRNLTAIGRALPDDLWAMFVWEQTGIPTAPVSIDRKDPSEIWMAIGPEHGGPIFFPVEVIAGQGSRWSVASCGAMGLWIEMLADVESHAAAYNAANSRLIPPTPQARKAAFRRGFLQGWRLSHPDDDISTMPDIENVLKGLGVNLEGAQAVSVRRNRTAEELDVFADVDEGRFR